MVWIEAWPELRLDVVGVGAVGDQQAGVGVAEVVKPDAAELGPSEGGREHPVPEVVGIERRGARSPQKMNSERREVESCCMACSSVCGISIARRERLDLERRGRVRIEAMIMPAGSRQTRYRSLADRSPAVVLAHAALPALIASGCEPIRIDVAIREWRHGRPSGRARQRSRARTDLISS